VVDVGNRKDRRFAGIDVADALDRDVEIERICRSSFFRTKLWIQKIAARRIPRVMAARGAGSMRGK
jgi:hypothetical protein